MLEEWLFVGTQGNLYAVVDGDGDHQAGISVESERLALQRFSTWQSRTKRFLQGW